MRHLTRRHFLSFAAWPILTPLLSIDRAIAQPLKTTTTVDGGEAYFFLERNAWVPNNASLPVRMFRPYRQASAGAAGKSLNKTAWRVQWTGPIYPFHHYHSTSHTAWLVEHGAGQVELGGANGRRLMLSQGDVLFIPAGTGMAMPTSSKVVVSAAYPVGCHWDVCREAPSKSAEARMTQLPVPELDSLRYWTVSSSLADGALV